MELASYALNVRVADVQTVYELWRSRGAHFLTPPIARARIDTGFVAVLRQVEGALIRSGRLIEEFLRPIGNPQPEVGLCKLRLQAQT